MKLSVKTLPSTLAMIGLAGMTAFWQPIDGLSCWKTPGSSFMNKMDPSRPIEGRVCLDSEKSCQSEMYNVGRHWYVKMGCSTQETAECSTEARGSGSEMISCYCTNDYCNSSSPLKARMTFAFFATSFLFFVQTTYLN
ncbi:hypothetical protein TCAL_03619 [Tigriopus californicus]|uniref:Protein sleepless n=1 Tax=Tigriopus californicus TaxID=6832 RepID=A0A553NE37_TIGCA|nr:uncharacterized protein LOC131888835 [Tigriopus californicus]TRY63700.1 hypothetical protein TCAL_03619 [Tigriopus californicus]